MATKESLPAVKMAFLFPSHLGYVTEIMRRLTGQPPRRPATHKGEGMNSVEALKVLLAGGSICQAGWGPMHRLRLKYGRAYVYHERSDGNETPYTDVAPSVQFNAAQYQWLEWKEPGISEADMVIGHEYRVLGGEVWRLLGILPSSIKRRYVFWSYAPTSTTVNGVTQHFERIVSASLEEISFK